MNFSESFACAVLLFCFYPRFISSDKQRPFYNIGHMVNSIEEIEEFLKKGANALEIDIQFFPNGSVKETNHGSPCDCRRTCDGRANLKDYLKHLRSITDPNTPVNYYEQLPMLFFDLKMETSNDKIESGRDIAWHVLNYLWGDNEDREQEIKVLLSFDNINDKDVVIGFRNEFERQGQKSRLKDVGFDGGSGSLSDIEKIFGDLKIENVWIGDGMTNCFSFIRPDFRVKNATAIRDSSDGFIDKVYKWTIDMHFLMREALNIGVDAMITNEPDRLLEVIKEPEFERSFRLATVDDNPFEKYIDE
ncbi:Dermonecrotic toxin LiSicTox-alphaV1 like protein [Argiope bruennichi]|uniref:Dermonecrotic toxin LiSicTox-alphaV1 like protein n=1 Tax=Argiope bruennichi TaxID=94029 RepID=A0A8T0F8U6_ARGBR|nr:Dermonecrotic toxin LiSicTox-alphaV1 like protein [Argiope bruennichi]